MIDYKVGIIPRSGRPLAKINSIIVTATIAYEAGIRNSLKRFQLRFEKEQNVIVASTLSHAIENALETLQKINAGENTYEVTVFLVVPANSCKILIYNTGIGCSVEEVRAVVEAPGYKVC
ncbi:hypothetical protein MTO96_052158 [Rhipicephalus appendiculatus]